MAEAKGTKSGGSGAGKSGAEPGKAAGAPSGGAGGEAGGGGSDNAGAGSGPVKLKNLWPLPALVLGGGLLVGGMVVYTMGKPKPPADVPLEQAKALVQDKRYQEAIDKLNSADVRNYIDYGTPDEEHRRAFHLARARAFAGAQETMGIDRPENHRVIVDEYEKAEHLGKEGATALPPTDESQVVLSLIALDEVDAALKRIGQLPDSEQARKSRLIRAVVDHNLAISLPSGSERAIKRSQQTLELLAGMAADPGLGPADKAWALARQGEMLIDSGRPDEAINKLIRRVGLLNDVPVEQQGELYVLLGKAYFQSDQPASAMRQLQAADEILDKASPFRADLDVMQGRLAQNGVAIEGRSDAGPIENDPNAMLDYAREKFETVIDQFGAGNQYARAVLGLAEVEASLRHDDKSLERYAELVELVNTVGASGAGAEGGRAAPSGVSKGEGEQAGKSAEATGKAGAPSSAHPAPEKGRPSPTRLAEKVQPRTLGEVTRRSVLTSLMQRFRERFDSGQLESSLRYASIAGTMYTDDETPPEVLLAIGSTRRALGDRLMDQAKEAHASGAGEGGEDFTIQDVDAATRAEIKNHYIIAGDYLRRHAKALAAGDPGASASSLWTAADSYDRAGDMEEAKKAFADYADTAADTDPHKPEAKFRLAQVFQARREYGAAAALYRALYEARDTTNPARNSGGVGDRAVVPLAQCLLAINKPADNEEAERLLKSVVEGGLLEPNSPEFRSALIELGESYYKQDRFAKAIEKLEDAAKRYKDDKRIESIRYLLADSHRREGVKIGQSLSTQKLPQAQMDQLESSRVEHLRTARALYEGVKMALGQKEPRTLTNLDKIHLRNSYFYLGDCAMELKDYDAAIAAYDDARKQYSEEPSSLVAMAQIVSAYVAQEKWAEARTANERARLQLAKFPESVWQNPDLPMEKRHWERWLDARTLISQQAAESKDQQ